MSTKRNNKKIKRENGSKSKSDTQQIAPTIYDSSIPPPPIMMYLQDTPQEHYLRPLSPPPQLHERVTKLYLNPPPHRAPMSQHGPASTNSLQEIIHYLRNGQLSYTDCPEKLWAAMRVEYAKHRLYHQCIKDLNVVEAANRDFNRMRISRPKDLLNDFVNGNASFGTWLLLPNSTFLDEAAPIPIDPRIDGVPYVPSTPSRNPPIGTPRHGMPSRRTPSHSSRHETDESDDSTHTPSDSPRRRIAPRPKSHLRTKDLRRFARDDNLPPITSPLRRDLPRDSSLPPRHNRTPYMRQRSTSRPRSNATRYYPGIHVIQPNNHRNRSPAIGVGLDPIGTPRYSLMPTGTMKTQVYRTMTASNAQHAPHSDPIPIPQRNQINPNVHRPLHGGEIRGGHSVDITVINHGQRPRYPLANPYGPTLLTCPRCFCIQGTDPTPPPFNLSEAQIQYLDDIDKTTMYGPNMKKGTVTWDLPSSSQQRCRCSHD